MASKVDAAWASFSSNVSEWSGLWTIWDAKTRKVKDVYNGLRSLQALNDEKTVIQQQNTYYHKDGVIRKPDPWEIRKENCDENGICHSAKPELRAVLHSNRSGAWISKKIPDGQCLFNEMFLQGDEVRCSVGLLYDASKELVWFSGIREFKLNEPKEFWSTNTELGTGIQLPNPDENFTGVEKTLSRNLDLSVAENCLWDKEFWDQRDDSSSDLVFHLPDNICLSCPMHLSSDFSSLRSCVLYNYGAEAEIQELTVTYADGHFVSVKQGIYRPFN